MIILYQVPDDEKGKIVRDFFAKENIEYLEFAVESAGHTLGELFKNNKEPMPHPAEQVPDEPAILFDEATTNQTEAAELLGTLEQAGVFFNYQVLVDANMLDYPLGDILVGHRDYQLFLSKLGFLQQMIDGCGALKEENYDPDKWSELKIIIANGNDFLDAVVSDTDSKFDDIKPEDVDKHITDLQLAMKKLLAN